MTHWLLYIMYVVRLMALVFLACMCYSQRLWNQWRRLGKTVFFGMTAVSTATVGSAVFSTDHLVIPLNGGVIFWTSMISTAALVCVCYGLWKARCQHGEDVV